MINSAMPNSQAKHRFPYKPAASAQRADAVLPYPTGVRRLSTLLLGPMESGSEAGFPWEKAQHCQSFCTDRADRRTNR